MKRITSKLLRRKRACRDQVDLFVKLGGDHLELTEELCVKYATKFDWNWASWKLLTPNARAKYDCIEQSAWEEYRRARHSAWMEYDRVEKSAWKEYDRTLNRSAAVKYLRHQQPAWAEYLRIERPALTEYRRACARAFFHAWTSAANKVRR